jgi:transposase-like protein
MARKKGQPQRRVGESGTELEQRIPRACYDERAAVEMLEELRWGADVTCPHCGEIKNAYQMKDRKTGERSERWLWKCRGCAKQFTYKIGTVMEDSRIPAKIWMHAIWRACSSKKGVSALQIKRETGLSYPSALHLMHRIRESMADRSGPAPKLEGTIEVDEVYIGGRYRGPKTPDGVFGRKRKPKAITIGILQRGGDVRLTHVPPANTEHVHALIRRDVNIPASRLMSDESNLYKRIGKEFGGGHEAVNHSAGEYFRAPDITSNGVEGVFSLLQRAIIGAHHHVSAKHLHRYLAERQFVFNGRFVSDGERVKRAVKASEGKRLRYRDQVGAGA